MPQSKKRACHAEVLFLAVDFISTQSVAYANEKDLLRSTEEPKEGKEYEVLHRDGQLRLF